jgi:intein/homing endonuclease
MENTSLNWIPLFKDQQVYLYGLHCLFKKIVLNVMLKHNIESYSKLSRYNSICQRSLYYWLDGRRPIPIKHFIYFISISDYSMEDILPRIKYELKGISMGSGARKKITNLPFFIDEELLYLVGYLFGDGCLKSKEWTIHFCDEYLLQIEKINTIIIKLFGIGGKITKFNDNKYELHVYSKALAIFFNKLFDMPYGKKKRIIMPKIIENDQKLKLSFLRGFSDADGGVPRMEEYKIIPNWILNAPNIEIASKYQNILLDLKEVLKKQGIIPNIYYHKKNDSYRLIISGKKNIFKCKEIVIFEHPIKEKRLKELVNSLPR